MRDYFRASPTFWRRGTGKRLRGDAAAQLVAWYLMVPPDGGLTGIFACSIESMARDIGLARPEVEAALVRLDKEDFAYFDPSEEIVWVVGTTKHQIPDGINSRKDNRWTSIVRELRQAGSHEFVGFFVAKYGVHLSVTADDLAGEERARATDRPSSRLGMVGSDPPGCEPMRPIDPLSCGPPTLPKPIQIAKGGNGNGRGMGEEGVQGDSNRSEAEPGAPTRASTPGTQPVTPKRGGPRGARIAEDWQPSAKTVAWCEAKGVDPVAVLEEFLAHWLSESGSEALKVDWDMAFQKRVLQLIKYDQAPKLAARPRPIPGPEAWNQKLQANLESAPASEPSGNPGLFTAMLAKVAT